MSHDPYGIAASAASFDANVSTLRAMSAQLLQIANTLTTIRNSTSETQINIAGVGLQQSWYSPNRLPEVLRAKEKLKEAAIEVLTTEMSELYKNIQMFKAQL